MDEGTIISGDRNQNFTNSIVLPASSRYQVALRYISVSIETRRSRVSPAQSSELANMPTTLCELSIVTHPA
jgi:hypothetical protein